MRRIIPKLPKLSNLRPKIKEPPRRFEVMEEAANLKLRIFGSSPRDLFKNALYAMGFTQKPEFVEQSTV